MGLPMVARGALTASVAALALVRLPLFAEWSLKARAALCLLAAYLPSYLDRAEYGPAPRRSGLARGGRAFFRALVPRVFNLKRGVVEAPEKLAACRQYILAVHPHGVLSLDHLLTVAGIDQDLEACAPQARRSALSAGVLFKLPGVRELALWSGCVDAGKETAARCLQAGLSLSVVPGGEREQLLAQRGPVETLHLRSRKGFVNLALKYGVPVVPVYCFGEAQLYHQSKFLFGLRSWVQRKLGVALVLPYGPGGVPGVPFPAPLRLVVGAPIEMPHIQKPSKEDLDKHHARYVSELEKLFSRHQEAAGYANVRLEIA